MMQFPFGETQGNVLILFSFTVLVKETSPRSQTLQMRTQFKAFLGASTKALGMSGKGAGEG